MTMTPERLAELDAVMAKATAGEWGVWAEPCAHPSSAQQELVQQVEQTESFVGALYLIEAEGKCPATTGCGPTSAANAAAIVALHNTYPDLRAHIDAQAATIARQDEALREIVGLVVEAIDLERIGAVVALDAIADVAHAALKGAA